MIEQDPGSGLRSDPLEQQLRDALRARAGSVDRSDLRPAALPSRHARFRLPVTRPVRRAVLALFVLAAAVACVLLVSAHWGRQTPVSPADVPSVSPNPSFTTAVPDSTGGGVVDAVPVP